MKKTLTSFLLLIAGICNGQNLVPNGDFEQYWNCPNSVSQIDSAKFWFKPSLGTPDYFHQCSINNTGNVQTNVDVPNNYFGYQPARSGDAFAGITRYFLYNSNYREYLGISISSAQTPALDTGACYHFEMYINLGNICHYNSTDIGVYFSDEYDFTWSNDPLQVTPQITNITGILTDTLNWTLISGDYTAHGGEKYLIIGSFVDDASTDTITVNSSGISMDYIFIDDVSLTSCSNVGISDFDNTQQISIYPNPFNSKLIISIDDNEELEVILYDIAARELLQQIFTNTITINTEQLPTGIYFLELKNKNGIIKNGKVIKI